MRETPVLPKVGQERYATPFYEGLEEGVIRIQECAACSKRQHFPRPWCQYCASEETTWVECSGRGVVYSYTVPHRVVEAQEFEDQLPYVVAIIELDEGPRIISNIVGCSVDEVDVDMRVGARFDGPAAGKPLVWFEPVAVR